MGHNGHTFMAGFDRHFHTGLLLVAILTSAAQRSCPPGWLRRNDACYRLVDTLMDHKDAMNYCIASKSTLASVHSHEDIDFLVSNLFGNRKNAFFWLGGRPFSRDIAEYTWIDRTEFAFKRWAPNKSPNQTEPSEPNDFGKNCAGLVLDANGWMLDDECSLLRFPICKIWLTNVNTRIDEQTPVHLLDRILRSDAANVLENMRELEETTSMQMKKIRSEIFVNIQKFANYTETIKQDFQANLTRVNTHLEASIGKMSNYTYLMDGKFEHKITVQGIETDTLRKDLSNIRIEMENLQRTLGGVTREFVAKAEMDKEMQNTIDEVNRKLKNAREHDEKLLKDLNGKLDESESVLSKRIESVLTEAMEKFKSCEHKVRSQTMKLDSFRNFSADTLKKYASEMSNSEIKLRTEVQELKQILGGKNASLEHENIYVKLERLNTTVNELLEKSLVKEQRESFHGLSANHKTAAFSSMIAAIALTFGLIVGCYCKRDKKQSQFVPKATFAKHKDGSEHVRFNENLYDNVAFR